MEDKFELLEVPLYLGEANADDMQPGGSREDELEAAILCKLRLSLAPSPEPLWSTVCVTPRGKPGASSSYPHL